MISQIQTDDNQFPVLVYKNNGPYQRAGGTYDHKAVADETEFETALTDGWFASLPAAIEGQLVIQEVTQEPSKHTTQEHIQLGLPELNPEPVVEPVVEPAKHGKRR